MAVSRVLIIPARGGSKEIPKKNLQKVNGISLIERALRTAIKSKVDKIIVSTDDSDIIKISEKYKIIVHNRSNLNSSDEASTESVILEVIKDLGQNWPPETVIGFYQVTSAFVRPETINECFSHSERGFSAFSAVVFHSFVWEENSNWLPVNHPLDHRPRRQDLSQKVKETGAIYTFPMNEFKEKKYRFCSAAYPVKVEKLSSFEIDEQSDLKLANLIATQFESLNFKLSSLNKPKILFTDFDGCLTNDKVKVNIFGKENVVVNRKDGLAVKRLKKLGIQVVIATTETNDVVAVRAKKMNVEILKGLENKVEAITSFLSQRNLSWADIWYLGNDVNDLGPIEKAALSFCPIDASPEIFTKSQVVLSRRGGEGLLAEIASRLESGE
jgi:YrbI family 3-deoxy-D-manno-octulosonate 8-phosphate phosphatase